MAYTTGTAASWRDLMTTIITWLTDTPATPGRDWTVELSQERPSLPGYYEKVLSNTGISELESVVVGIAEYYGGLRQGWQFNVYTSWLAGQAWNANYGQHGSNTWNSTYGGYTYHPHVPLITDNITYWIASNKQRIMGVFKCGSRYESFYLGFGNRLGTSANYPYPYYAAGSGGALIDYADETNEHRYCISPRIQWAYEGGYSTGCRAFVVSPSNTFLGNQAYYDYLRMQPHAYVFYPYDSWTNNIGRDTNGRWPVFPVYAISQNFGAMFSLDGMCWLPGVFLQAEDRLNIDGEEWIVFPNIFRTSAGNFMAMNTGEASSITTTTTTTTSSTTTTTTAP